MCCKLKEVGASLSLVSLLSMVKDMHILHEDLGMISVAIEVGHSIIPYSLDPTMAGDTALRVCHFDISAVELSALWLQMRVFPFKPIDLRLLKELKNKKL